MTRLALSLTLVATFTLSSSVALDAQRGSGVGAVGSGVGSARGVTPPVGGRGGGRGGGVGRGGFQIQRRINQPPALPSINRPSFPVGGLNRPAFPLTGPLGFGRAQAQRSPFDARRGTYTRLQQSVGIPYGYGGSGYGYDVPAYGDSYVPESTYEKLYRTPEPPITEGVLFFDVTPATALVYIDNGYVGNAADLQTRGLTLPSGHHWVDLEAPNYDKKTFEVTIRAGEPLRYRFDMSPTRRADVIPAPPRPPQTMYMIAGCYAGNRPPVAANLPTGCDISKVRVIRPQGGTVR
jgi:PEGA domain